MGELALSAEDLGNWRNKCFFEGRPLSLLRLLEFIFKKLHLIGLLQELPHGILI